MKLDITDTYIIIVLFIFKPGENNTIKTYIFYGEGEKKDMTAIGSLLGENLANKRKLKTIYDETN